MTLLVNDHEAVYITSVQSTVKHTRIMYNTYSYIWKKADIVNVKQVVTINLLYIILGLTLVDIL